MPHPRLWPTLGLLALYAVFYVQFAAALVAFPFDVDQGEGYDAWSAWLIHSGQLPYSDNEHFPYYSSNYPPLWSWLVSIPMAWSGPGLGPARFISAASGVLAAVVVGLAARRRAGNNLAGFLAGGFFLASPYVFHTTPLARVNATALLFGLIGLALFESPTPRRLVLGSLALLAALFTKQTELDAAAAAVLFVLVVNRRQGAAAGALIATVLLTVSTVLTIATGGAFWLNVVAGNVNPFDLGQLASYLANFLLLHAIIAMVAVVEMVRALKRREWSPWVFYLPVSAAMALAAGKWGAGESYFLGALAAACVLAAGPLAGTLATGSSMFSRARSVMALRASQDPLAATRVAHARAPEWQSRAMAPGVLGVALAIQALLMAHGPLSQLVPWLPDRGLQAELLAIAPTELDRAAGEKIADLIRQAEGPALVEDPSFAVAAGKEVVGNATHLRNLHEAGLWDPSALVADLEARRFGVVVLNAALYPVPVLLAIGRSYYLDSTIDIRASTYQIFLPGVD